MYIKLIHGSIQRVRGQGILIKITILSRAILAYHIDVSDKQAGNSSPFEI